MYISSIRPNLTYQYNYKRQNQSTPSFNGIAGKFKSKHFDGYHSFKEHIKDFAGNFEGKAKSLLQKAYRAAVGTDSNLSSEAYDKTISNSYKMTKAVQDKFFVIRRNKKLKEIEERKSAKLDECLDNMGVQVQITSERIDSFVEQVDDAIDGISAMSKRESIEHRKILRQMYSKESYVGFDKIAGSNYDDIKEILDDNFIQEIAKEKMGQPAEIPPAFLFFGPTGNGKTTFANAIAEQTGCPIVKISHGIFNKPEGTYNNIIEAAKKAEERFQKDRTRTILFIDEISGLLSKEDTVTYNFAKFLETCSDKYHCTVFGGTNHISKIAVDVKKSFPVRISVDPPTKKDAAEIFAHYLARKTAEDINYDNAAEAMFQYAKLRGGVFSNSFIKEVVTKAIDELEPGSQGVTESGLIKAIAENSQESGYLIDGDKMIAFNQDVEKYL